MDLSKHLEKAAEAVKRRNYPFAVKLYSQLLALQPDSGDARAGLRSALFKKAEQKAPSKVFAWLGGGVHLLTARLSRTFGKHASAARAYERYLVLDPLDEGANLRLAQALEKAGFARSALAVYRAFAEHEPRCLPAARKAGELLYASGEHAAALQMYEQALKVDPRDQESLKARKNLAAEGALKTSGLEGARHSRELIKDKDQQRRLEKTDRLQLSAEEIDQELDQLEPRLAERPDDVATLLRVGDLYRMRSDRKGALDAFERALAADPARTELLDKVGDLRLELQEDRVRVARERGDESAAAFAQKALAEASAAEYRRRVERNPTDLSLRFSLGASLLELGEVDTAIAELQQAVKDPRRRAEALWMLGRAFRRKGLADLALGQLHKALEAASRAGTLSKDILYELGEVAEELGRRDEALGFFSRILEQDIGFRDVTEKVERLERAGT